MVFEVTQRASDQEGSPMARDVISCRRRVREKYTTTSLMTAIEVLRPYIEHVRALDSLDVVQTLTQAPGS